MKGRWALRLVLGVVAMCLAIPTALGDEKTPLDKELDQVWGKERDIKVIEKRLFEKDGRHEFGIFVGLAPNDDFFNYWPLGIRYDYYIIEQVSIEFAGAYVFKQDTKLKSFILDNFGVSKHGAIGSAGIPQSVEWYAGLNAYWAPIHGKIAAFGTKLSSFDLGLIFGVGAIGTKVYPAESRKVGVEGNVGLGFHFFLSDLLALRLDYRHYIFQADDSGYAPGGSSGARQMAEFTLGFSVFTKAPQ